MNTHLLWRGISLITYVSAGCLLFVLIFWSLWPYKTAEVEQPFPLVSNQLNQGDVIAFYVRGYRYTEVDVEIEKTLQCDGQLYLLDKVSAQGITQPKGQIDSIATQTRVPEITPDGSICIVRFRNSYQVNPIRDVVVWFETEPFEVI